MRTRIRAGRFSNVFGFGVINQIPGRAVGQTDSRGLRAYLSVNFTTMTYEAIAAECRRASDTYRQEFYIGGPESTVGSFFRVHRSRRRISAPIIAATAAAGCATQRAARSYQFYHGAISKLLILTCRRMQHGLCPSNTSRRRYYRSTDGSRDETAVHGCGFPGDVRPGLDIIRVPGWVRPRGSLGPEDGAFRSSSSSSVRRERACPSHHPVAHRRSLSPPLRRSLRGIY